jgi:predicted HicB family RNase H-like nuclease
MRKNVKSKSNPQSFRFNLGIKEASEEAAEKKGVSVTALIEQLLRDEFEKLGIEVKIPKE